MKPEFIVDIAEGSDSSLEAHHTLTAINPDEGRHTLQNLRPALGIYNTSISRICDKINKCCGKLEIYFNTSTERKVLLKENALRGEIIDYLELSLYAAAEHVDDIQLISKYFFENKKQYKSSVPATILSNTIGKRKNLITASINAIKHHQARIRLYSVDIKYAKVRHCLHGYFVEGVNDGVVGPNKIFHDKSKRIFSITSLIWEILCFILNSSRHLSEFLGKIIEIPTQREHVNNNIFVKSIIAAARLPLYSFDDNHPFGTTRVVITASDTKSIDTLDSKIYGSIRTKWDKSDEMVILGDICNFEGDDVTKSFEFAHPSRLQIQHWD